jgi:hexosaminidase
MMIRLYSFLVFFFLVIVDLKASFENPKIIPAPEYNSFKGPATIRIIPITPIVVKDKKFLPYAYRLKSFLSVWLKWNPEVIVQKKKSPGVMILLEPSLRDSTGKYEMHGNERGVQLKFDRGSFSYAFASLTQIFLQYQAGNMVLLPRFVINDSPRFAWRGMHMDVSRHFFPVSFIKRYIDILSLYKMNVFHWHLTDDQGWRIEIKKYPRLTSVGGWRNGSMLGHYNEQRFDTVRYGGFYTQDEIREVVAYAADRGVTVVPEIEMPGHAMAALAAYPEYSCTRRKFEVGKTWGVYDDVFCTRDSVFSFLEEVLLEVIELFPSQYIHIGGDEVPKTRWKACSHCQQRIKDEKLKDEHDLQSYFIRRIERFVNTKGRQIIGWDEILEGGLAPNATVMSWRGEEGGIAAANENHYAVMTPGSHCYFDHYQSYPAGEPVAIGGLTTVQKVYSYEPIPAQLEESKHKFILGAQGNVWTEYINTPADVEYMVLPRMLALSEVLWSGREKRNLATFLTKIQVHFSWFNNSGINYSESVYKTTLRVHPAPNGVLGEVLGETSLGKLSYSVVPMYMNSGKGSVLDSFLNYSKPFIISKDSRIQTSLTLFSGEKKLISEQKVFVHKASSRNVNMQPQPSPHYKGFGSFTLVDGIFAQLPRINDQWLAWSGEDVVLTIDLGGEETIEEITIGSLEDHTNWIWLPSKIVIEVSDRGEQFKKIAEYPGKMELRGKREFYIRFPLVNTRYIRLNIKNPGKIPEGFPGEGKESWMFFDEIMVR